MQPLRPPIERTPRGRRETDVSKDVEGKEPSQGCHRPKCSLAIPMYDKAIKQSGDQTVQPSNYRRVKQ